MSEVVITVRGESERRIVAEEAIVRVSVRADGPDRGAVVGRAQQRAEAVQEDLVAHQRSGEVTRWSSGRVAVGAERPWNAEGRQLALVHHASVEFTATFVDARALSWWVGDVTASDDVHVDAVEWQLSSETRARAERDVATKAVRVALERAEAYADALGLASVTALEIADTGLLASRGEPPAPFGARLMAASADAGPAFRLQPAEIVVASTVEGRFRAR